MTGGPPSLDVSTDSAGERMHALIAELFPIVRSITGDGVRQTLSKVAQRIPLDIHEIPSGTGVFDWTIPKEWNVREAYIAARDGRRVIDLKNHPLHLMGYSVPVRKKLPLTELKQHLVSLPDHPDWIPYRTSYYEERWGFCLSHRQLMNLSEGEYEVVIDSSLTEGSLTYGECFLPGESVEEVLFSGHVCHPGLCNDNLAGIAVAVELAAALSSRPRRYSYRFLFAPGTIGSIAWLSRNREHISKIKHGLVLAMLGDAGAVTYKKSRKGDAEIDRAVHQVLKESGQPFGIEDFSPYGYDERQFCSPGFNLPVGRLTRTPHGKFPEYHTSADSLDFVKPRYLADSLDKLLSIVSVLEKNERYLNTQPYCEPQLGRRGLFRAIGGQSDPALMQMALLWVLNYSDGQHALLDIAGRSGLSFETIRAAADLLLQHDLLSTAHA